LARLDLEKVASSSRKTPIVSAAEWLSNLLTSSSTASKSCFSGIVISNWEELFSIPLLKEFIFLLGSLNLCVYLEVAPPSFLCDPSLAELDVLTGILIRNGTISKRGEERTAFQMAAEMRRTIKAFVSQACLRNFVVLLWETLDDNARPANAIIKRSYTFARFYSALPWIGSNNSLVSAELCINQKEPFGAFDWLKESKVLEFHEKWRSSVTVRVVFCNRG